MTTYVNEAIAQLLGYSAREMIGVPVLDFATPESAKIIKEKTQSRISDGIDHETYELKFFHRSGKIIQARITAAAIRDEDGIVQETYGLIRDITKEREREQELKRTKTFLESIIAAMPSGVYSYDLNEKITMANPKLAKILGYTNENELLGRSVYDLFPKRDHSHIKSLIKERMTGKPSEEFMMITYQTRQGQEVKTTVTSVPLVIGNEVEGSVVSVSDITEQNLVEDHLHKISHEYRTLLEKLDLGIIKVDNLGKIVSYNHKVAELLNFAAFSDLGDFNILEYQPFKEAGLHSEFRDLLYKRTVEKTIVAPLIDEFGKKQELKFQFLPVHDQNMETFAWFLFIEPAN
jgi:PAS domain S-box-containing protein